MEEIIKDIRKRCRMAMNGIASTSMRKQGVDYKLNFGVSIQKIKEIAERYTPEKDLAETLWEENTRELKILATLLYPIEEFTKEVADRWVKDISHQEIREQACINLFQKLDFAGKLATEWTAYEDEDIRATGYWLIASLIKIKRSSEVHLDRYPEIWEDVVNNNTSLKNAALTALKFFGRVSKAITAEILSKLAPLNESDDLAKKEIYNSLKFEFEYLFE